MPVIKDVIINGGFNRERTLPLLPPPSKQPSPQKGNAINVTTLTLGFTQDNSIDFKTPLRICDIREPLGPSGNLPNIQIPMVLQNASFW